MENDIDELDKNYMLFGDIPNISNINVENNETDEFKKIKSKTNGVDLYYGGESEFFDYDKVILATHADEALSIIESPSEEEKKFYQILVTKKTSPISTQTNRLCQKTQKFGLH